MNIEIDMSLYKYNDDYIEYLIKSGANVNKLRNGISLVGKTISNGGYERCLLLLKYGADPDNGTCLFRDEIKKLRLTYKSYRQGTLPYRIKNLFDFIDSYDTKKIVNMYKEINTEFKCNTRTCRICYESYDTNLHSAATFQCGHIICISCAKNNHLRRCPICNVDIKIIIPLFF